MPWKLGSGLRIPQLSFSSGLFKAKGRLGSQSQIRDFAVEGSNAVKGFGDPGPWLELRVHFNVTPRIWF